MTSRLSRRDLLKRTAALSLLGSAGSFAADVAAMSTVAAQLDEYRALVCLFLLGGNDHTNLLVPTDTETYAEYAAARPSIALQRDTLAATDLGPTASQGGRSFALHPSLAGIRQLYLDADAAIVANVGPLIVPTTVSQYLAGSVALPPKLRSHNDQQSAWQARQASGEGAHLGWGGSLADRLMNTNSSNVFTAVSTSGRPLFLSGSSIAPFQMSTSGGLNLKPAGASLYGSARGSVVYQQMLTAGRAHLFEDEISAVTRRSLDANARLRTSLPPAGSLSPALPANNLLAAQLHVVARTIAAQTGLGTNRQVFFVGLGGFDTHDQLVPQQNALLRQVDTAVTAFWSWLGQLGRRSQVVLFTASDFGRALASNGDGSDHGWGAHHLVIGGDVNGGTIYGDVPPAAFGSSVDVGNGVFVPTISVDQYAARLGRWFGVSAADLDLVLPNLQAFDPDALISLF